MRIGHGYDAHRFGNGDTLVLGGVHIAHDHGLVAHSDGDVLIHAICDALLGAMGQGDIGQHFLIQTRSMPVSTAAFYCAESYS